jgi:hypothetical protein
LAFFPPSICSLISWLYTPKSSHPSILPKHNIYSKLPLESGGSIGTSSPNLLDIPLSPLSVPYCQYIKVHFIKQLPHFNYVNLYILEWFYSENIYCDLSHNQTILWNCNLSLANYYCISYCLFLHVL